MLSPSLSCAASLRLAWALSTTTFVAGCSPFDAFSSDEGRRLAVNNCAFGKFILVVLCIGLPCISGLSYLAYSRISAWRKRKAASTLAANKARTWLAASSGVPEQQDVPEQTPEKVENMVDGKLVARKDQTIESCSTSEGEDRSDVSGNSSNVSVIEVVVA